VCLPLPPRGRCLTPPALTGRAPCRPTPPPLLSHASLATSPHSFPHFFLCLSTKATDAPSMILPCVTPPPHAPPTPQIVSLSTPIPSVRIAGDRSRSPASGFTKASPPLPSHGEPLPTCLSSSNRSAPHPPFHPPQAVGPPQSPRVPPEHRRS
jgi:hypothetical protein